MLILGIIACDFLIIVLVIAVFFEDYMLPVSIISIGILLLLQSAFTVIASDEYNNDFVLKKIEARALDNDFAGYNKKTGEFEWYDLEMKYFMTGEKQKEDKE